MCAKLLKSDKSGKIEGLRGRYMKNNDKFLAAFLVSMGLFSTVQAEQYLSALSLVEKQTLSAVAADASDNVEPSDPNRLTINQDR